MLFTLEDAKVISDALIEADTNGTVVIKYGISVGVYDSKENKLEDVSIGSRLVYIEDSVLEGYKGVSLDFNIDRMRNNRGRVVKRRLYIRMYKEVNHNLILLENGIEEDNPDYMNE